MKTFTLEEVKIAAMDALAATKMDDPDTIVDTLRGMQLLISALAEKMKAPEPVAEETAGKTAGEPKKAKKDPNGPVVIVQPGEFKGYGAIMKRATYNRMMQLRTEEDKTVTEIAAMTDGRLTSDEIRAMCGVKKVPYTKWEILAEVLGTKEVVA